MIFIGLILWLLCAELGSYDVGNRVLGYGGDEQVGKGRGEEGRGERWRREEGGSEEAVVVEAEVVAAAVGGEGDDDVVEESDAEDGAGFFYAAGEILVVLAWGEGARRMVVRDGDGDGVVLDGVVEEYAEVDVDRGEAAERNLGFVEDFTARVEIDGVELLVRKVFDFVVYDVVKILAIKDIGCVLGFFLGRHAATQLEGGEKGDGFDCSDAFKFHEIRGFALGESEERIVRIREDFLSQLDGVVALGSTA